MDVLIRHSPWCDAQHDSDGCCTTTMPVGDEGAVHLYADETGPAIYVEDPKRGLFDEQGRYELDEAEAYAHAMLRAVRLARSSTAADRSSASADAHCRSRS